MREHALALSDIWSRAPWQRPGLRFERTSAEWILGRSLGAWRAGEAVEMEPLARQQELARLQQAVEAARAPGTSAIDLAGHTRTTRSWTGLAEAVLAVSVSADRSEGPFGILAFSRRVVGANAIADGGEGALVDLEVELDALHVLPAHRRVGHGGLLGAALATTIVTDVTRLAAGAGRLGTSIDLCISLSGVSADSVTDRIVRGTVGMLEQGLEMLDLSESGGLADLRLSLQEFELYRAESRATAATGNGLIRAV